MNICEIFVNILKKERDIRWFWSMRCKLKKLYIHRSICTHPWIEHIIAVKSYVPSKMKIMRKICYSFDFIINFFPYYIMLPTYILRISARYP